MAVDTAAKRASALNFADGGVMPIPDSSVDQSDWPHLLNLYAGLTTDQADATGDPSQCFVLCINQQADFVLER